MIDLRPDDAINKQQAAYGDVAAASPESWSHVTSSCRRILKDVCLHINRNPYYRCSSVTIITLAPAIHLYCLMAWIMMKTGEISTKITKSALLTDWL
jgi:hypothetical protein